MTQEKKELIDKFIIEKYDTLLKCSRDLFRNKGHLIKKTATEEPYELINQLVEDLYDERVMFDENKPHELIKICIGYLNNQFWWPESHYKLVHKDIRFRIKRSCHKPTSEYITEGEKPVTMSIDTWDTQLADQLINTDDVAIELQAEQASDEAKDYMLDLMVSDFTTDQIKRILQCKILYSTILTQEERVLFKLYFEEGLTQKQIVERFSKVMKVSQASVSLQLKDLKQKLLKHISEWNY